MREEDATALEVAEVIAMTDKNIFQISYVVNESEIIFTFNISEQDEDAAWLIVDDAIGNILLRTGKLCSGYGDLEYTFDHNSYIARVIYYLT